MMCPEPDCRAVMKRDENENWLCPHCGYLHIDDKISLFKVNK